MEKKLAEMKYEEEGLIKSIEEDLKNRIAGMGIRTGKKIKMLTKQPWRGPTVVLVDESRISLGRNISGKIIVEVKE